ncbi:hypothetical protein [Ramlibacter sp. WS9]|uniref:hypothetical protein n=1 Tax=Ramlibacter sp. WS9 TaxID=1882741 RepID=UPI001141A284|nr:hypothetical protein [Ramlibacter sp. WS9]ROZ69239.1 hypothetical protein EEB15_23940 [Ramlibacter sp. WS9]
MKFLKTSAIVLAAAAAAMLAPSAVESAATLFREEAMEAAQTVQAARHEVHLPYAFNPANTPPDATWGSVFSGNWR